MHWSVKGVLAVCFAVVVSDTSADAQIVPVLQATGQPAGRVNIVLVGDGYTAAELSTFAIDAQNMLSRLLSEQPLASYAHQINAWRIDAISVDSGVGEPARRRTRRLKAFSTVPAWRAFTASTMPPATPLSLPPCRASLST